jgi:hypothetical protein
MKVLPVGTRKNERRKQQEGSPSALMTEDQCNGRQSPPEEHDQHTKAPLTPNQDCRHANEYAGDEVNDYEQQIATGRNSRNTDREIDENGEDTNDPAERRRNTDARWYLSGRTGGGWLRRSWGGHFGSPRRCLTDRA